MVAGSAVRYRSGSCRAVRRPKGIDSAVRHRIPNGVVQPVRSVQ